MINTGIWRARVGILALTAAMLAACSSSTGASETHDASGTPAASTPVAAQPMVERGVEAAIETIPWDQVGPGWMLALWSPVTPTRPGIEPAPGVPTYETAGTTLYLVDPAGGRYPITTFGAPSGFGGPTLSDWSGDGSHALLSLDGSSGKEPTTAVSVDLHTGTQTTFPVVNGYVAGYASPKADAVLVGDSGTGDWPAWVERIDLAGNQQLTYPVGKDFEGGFLPTSDGSQLVLGTSTGLALMDSDGTAGKSLPVPGKLTHCSPVSLWPDSVVLARCAPEHFSSTTQLWQVPLDGGTPTALTAVNAGQAEDPGFAGDYGDVAAWQLPSGTFVQTLGACGTIHLARLTPDGHTTRVDVPGASESVQVVGASGDKLVLLAQLGCGGTDSLLTYDPAANTTDVLLGPPVNGGGVTETLLYPGKK
jgi:TolB protein